MKRLLALLLMLAWPAHASPVVADLSTYRIAIDAGFTGIRLFVFGARNEPGDVIVVVRGPERTFTVRKKERVAGLWINKAQLRFKNVPDFYAIASTRPLDQIRADMLRSPLGIGMDTILSEPARLLERPLFPSFAAAFLSYQQSRRLYSADSALSFVGETLFKTVIPFPDTIPRGDYTVETFLISDGELVGMQSVPIRVEKSGVDAVIADFAHNAPLFYGITAVLLAVGAGWAAGRLFQKI
jgi:uncharacterized protein (TIGR02186 family)